MKLMKFATIGSAAAALGLLAFATTGQAGEPWHSVVANTDFGAECSTSAVATAVAALPGGASCYSTTQFVPGSANVLRVTVSTTGNTHGGAALQLGCRIRPGLTGVWSFCNPLGAGDAPGFYITKNKLPTNPLDGAVPNNCSLIGIPGDGFGGSADCHDNSIEQTWCIPIVGDDTFDIDVRIASNPGGAGSTVFIEASTFFVDSTKVDGQCNG